MPQLIGEPAIEVVDHRARLSRTVEDANDMGLDDVGIGMVLHRVLSCGGTTRAFRRMRRPVYRRGLLRVVGPARLADDGHADWPG